MVISYFRQSLLIFVTIRIDISQIPFVIDGDFNGLFDGKADVLFEFSYKLIGSLTVEAHRPKRTTPIALNSWLV